MNTNSHSIDIKAPAPGKRKGTTVSLRNAIVEALDKELVPTQLGVHTKTDGRLLESVTLVFNYEGKELAGKG